MEDKDDRTARVKQNERHDNRKYEEIDRSIMKKNMEIRRVNFTKTGQDRKDRPSAPIQSPDFKKRKLHHGIVQKCDG